VTTPLAGHEPSSGLFWERVGDPGAAAAPWLLIHGGGATGACFRSTALGAAGWADLLAEAGVPSWVTDWPGVGRSGGRDPLGLRYEDLIDGYEALLRTVIRRPVVLVCHSMGGAIAWPLVERAREMILGVIAVAASYPGNIQPPSVLVEHDDHHQRIRFPASGVEFTVETDRLYRYSDDYLLNQGIAGSMRFPRERLEAFRSSLVGIPPRVLLQRLGFEDGLPRVHDTTPFRGLPVQFVFGSEDPAHTPAIEARTERLLAGWGAKTQLVALSEHGVDGNGHFIYAEENAAEALHAVLCAARDHLELGPLGASDRVVSC
jgi:pimeloyl-ACP methyl ester carboxylesterase